MSRHRHQPPPRVRPRYPRIAAALTSMGVTLVAVLGGMGAFSVDSPAAAEPRATLSAQVTGPRATPATTPRSVPRATSTPAPSRRTPSGSPAAAALPADSGSGRRVVFDISDQRVWLVGTAGEVASTYLVSGSLTDNLRPGSYAVYSRSRWAVGVDDSGVMQYFVRFAHGQHAAIGFHSIPTSHGRALQTLAQLGTPQSHGCIRQALPDALRMWHFATTGTRVVVTA